MGYTTPHNIQRNTPQTETCDACHGNEAIFLTADKVYPEELEANLPVIVDEIPPSIFELLATPRVTPTPEITDTPVLTDTVDTETDGAEPTPTATSP
jgi:hypothetical protein